MFACLLSLSHRLLPEKMSRCLQPIGLTSRPAARAGRKGAWPQRGMGWQRPTMPALLSNIKESDPRGAGIGLTPGRGWNYNNPDCHVLPWIVIELSSVQSTTGFPLPREWQLSTPSCPRRRASRFYLKKLSMISKESKWQKSFIVQMAKPLNSDLAQRARVSMLD